MSDTDTDDTDQLLLIPPNYYTEREKKMNGNAVAHADALAMPPPSFSVAPPTAAYRFLHPHKKSELNRINARLQNMDLQQDDEAREEDRRYEAPSDISSISTNTVKTAVDGDIRQQRERERDLHGMIHSTPKSNSMELRRHHHQEENILIEIDNHLGEHRQNSAYKYREQPRIWDTQDSMPAPAPPQATSLPSMREGASATGLSLSELWGKSHLAGTVINSPSLKEEQLRRQHLEKLVQSLQVNLLEYEQRISVALEVDRCKDAALQQAAEQSKTLNYELQHLRDLVNRLETERSDALAKHDSLQQELAQAMGLSTNFQRKLEELEAKLEHNRRQESNAVQQLDQLEMQLQSSKHSEELLHVELGKLRDKYTKADYQQGKLKARIEELEKFNGTLHQQKEMLQEYHQKQKTRADHLETQRKSLQEALANLTDIETNLKKKLEMQQHSLKHQYQQQMENVVAKKLQEFQTQLDKSEEHLKAEARERERLIADRAVKQLEMINEKNNQELNLIQEKHNEEVELYRLQLANASKKIDDLELQLSSYKNKRADIAEKLHGVMEAQWQQALAILTSPNQTFQLPGGDSESDSPDLNNARHYPETPKSSKTQRSSNTEKNNLDVVGKRDPASPMDKLQAYIELLLSKTPADIEKLDQILALKAKQTAKPQKHTTKKTPPWKA